MTDTCKTHGDIIRDADGRCPQCRNGYMRKYLKDRRAKRKKFLKTLKPKKG